MYWVKLIHQLCCCCWITAKLLLFFSVVALLWLIHTFRCIYWQLTMRFAATGYKVRTASHAGCSNAGLRQIFNTGVKAQHTCGHLMFQCCHCSFVQHGGGMSNSQHCLSMQNSMFFSSIFNKTCWKTGTLTASNYCSNNSGLFSNLMFFQQKDWESGWPSAKKCSLSKAFLKHLLFCTWGAIEIEHLTISAFFLGYIWIVIFFFLIANTLNNHGIIHTATPFSFLLKETNSSKTNTEMNMRAK